MMRFDEGLTSAEQVLLRRILGKRKPSLLRVIDMPGDAPLSTEQRESLRAVLADELSEAGLRADSEPNDYGLRIDRLIGRLKDR